MIGLGLGVQYTRNRIGGEIVSKFYVRPTGGVYGTGDGASYINAWSGFENIVWSSVENNTLAVCGTHTGSFDVNSSNLTIIGDDINESGIIDGLGTAGSSLTINNKNNVTLTGLSILNGLVDCLMIEGTSSNIITNNCIFNGSGNQGIQHLGSVSATHNNPTCNNNVDDGISLHDSAVAVINEGTFEGNGTGVNAIATSNTTINGPITMIDNVVEDVWAANAITDESCVITINDCVLNNRVRASNKAKLIVNNSNLSNLVVADDAGTGYAEVNRSICSSVRISVDGFLSIDGCLISTFQLLGGTADVRNCRVNNGIGFLNNFTLKMRRSLISGGGGFQLDATSGGTIDIAYSVFNDIASTGFGLVLRTGVIVENLHNCTFTGIGRVGRGMFAQESNTYYNLLFTGLGVGFFRAAGTQILENTCFFDNTTNKSGTVTSNDEVTTDPLLTNIAGFDFSLGVGSSCINTGEVLIDNEGIESADWGDGVSVLPTIITKLQGEFWDIGAYVS